MTHGGVYLRLQHGLRRLASLAAPAPSPESLAADWAERLRRPGARWRVLYLALKYDYGNPWRGISYEEYNFYHTLARMEDVELVRLDLYELVARHGARLAGETVRELCHTEAPDCLFFLLWHDIIDHRVWREIRERLPVETILWLFDDDKRADETRELVRCFDKVVTTIDLRHRERLEAGLPSLLAQFGANHYLYRDYGLPRDLDVVFIGQNFGYRAEWVRHLTQQGVKVHAFGRGWSGAGRLSQGQMVEILGRAKIVLNFSGSAGHPELKFIKGRVFEIPAAGALLLTEQCQGLEDYFHIGEELDVFDTPETMTAQVRRYLADDALRQRVAAAGKARVLAEHTLEGRLRRVLAA